MKYKQSQLLILASTLTFMGVPGFSSHETTFNFLATQSAQAGQDNKPEAEKKTKPSFFKRLMQRAQVPTESRQHFPADIDMSTLVTQEKAPSSVAQARPQSTQSPSPQNSTINPTRPPLQKPVSTPATSDNAKQEGPNSETAQIEQIGPQVGPETDRNPPTEERTERVRRSARPKASRHYQQLAVEPMRRPHSQTPEILALRNGINADLTRTGHELQNMNQHLVGLHQETCDAENKFNQCRRVENTQRERIEKVKAESVRSQVKLSFLDNRDASAIHLQDQLAAHVVQTWTRSGKWAFLAIGNTKTVLDHYAQKEIRKLVLGLNQSGYEVMYDADSNEAPVIAEASKGTALGLSGKPIYKTLDHSSILVIENPFLRMQAMASASKIIMTPDSILGLGLLLEEFTTQSKEFLVYDPDNKWKKGLSSWQASLSDGHEHSSFGGHSNYGGSYGGGYSSGVSYDPQGNRYEYSGKRDKTDWARAKERERDRERERTAAAERDRRPRNLGIRFPESREPKSYARISDLIKQIRGPYLDTLKQPTEPARFLATQLPISLLNIVDQIDLGVLQTQMTFAKNYQESVESVRAHGQEHGFYNSGAAFFGSKEAPYEVEKTVKEVVEAAVKRGFPITTGGSGGLMDTANRIAKGTDGYSIGIPCGGVANEVSANHLHDLNISTKGYEQRIPLILLDKKLVMIAPGGSGTMKEVATTFVQIASGERASQTHMMFIGLKYYQGFGTFMNQVLPPAYLEEMSLVDTSQEFEQIFEQVFEQRTNL